MVNIVVRDPFDLDTEPDFPRLRELIGRVLGGTPWDVLPATWIEEPVPVDISMVNGNLKVEASVPGFAKEEIEVSLRNGVLSIDAKHTEEHEAKKPNYYHRERRSGAISRRISLPARVSDDAQVEAELKDGVLCLVIQVPSEEKAKRIEIRGA